MGSNERDDAAEHLDRPIAQRRPAALPERALLPPWQDRVRHAEAVMDAFDESFLVGDAGTDRAEQWIARVDQTSHVGSRHHTVPRFVLNRWAQDSRVQTYSKVGGSFATRNVRDLAIRDFYTFIDVNNAKNSLIESVLGAVETAADPVLAALLDPFSVPRRTAVDELAALAQFASFQVVRTARHRREQEIQAEYLAKTMAQGRLTDEQLSSVTLTAHQNEAISMMGPAAQRFLPLFACRPLAMVSLAGGATLLIGDEPVIVNAQDDETHHADCLLTDDEFAARLAKERRRSKKGRRRREVSRVVHMTSTIPRGLGVAHEIVMPVSPRAALVWGPLSDGIYVGDIVRDQLDPTESRRFADLLNERTCGQALDWIVTTISDSTFPTRDFPPNEPLMKVCDGVNAASVGVNSIPIRMRPSRLWTP